jgi:hypothetical protein
LVRWAAPYRSRVREAWLECPRGSWALEVAVRAGVDHALVALAVQDLDETSGRAGDHRSSYLRNAALTATRDLAEGDLELDLWVGAIEAWLLDQVDADPAVREAQARVRQAARAFSETPFTETSLDYDEVYLAVRHRFAERVRRRIPAEAIEATMGVRSDHPYR